MFLGICSVAGLLGLISLILAGIPFVKTLTHQKRLMQMWLSLASFGLALCACLVALGHSYQSLSIDELTNIEQTMIGTGLGCFLILVILHGFEIVRILNQHKS